MADSADNRERQPEEGKEGTLSAEGNGDPQPSNPRPSSMVAANHLTSLGLSFFICRVGRTAPFQKEQYGATDRAYMQIATNRTDNGIKDAPTVTRWPSNTIFRDLSQQKSF